jgi:threonyl-tRNA synthetase
MIPLHSLRAYVIELLGLALVELFPGVQLVRSRLDGQGFVYEVVFPQPLHPELLDILEEKMRQLFKEGVSFSLIEMMAENAAAFFENFEQPYLAERALESPESTLQLVRKGSYADFLPVIAEAFPLEVEPFAFKLYDVQSLDEGVAILGTAFFDKEELKAWVKNVGKKLKAPETDWLAKLNWANHAGCLLPQGVEEVERWRMEWRRWMKMRILL